MQIRLNIVETTVPLMFKHKRIAIDFDGTLFEDVSDINEAFLSQKPLTPKSGAAKTMGWLKTLGFELLIFTCRPDYHRTYMERQLTHAGILHDYILFYTKPRVDLYIDDKGFRFTDWTSTRRFIETNLYDTVTPGSADQSPDTLYEQHLRNSRLKKVALMFPQQEVKRILDVGCARGQAPWRNLPYAVDGFDINKQFLKIAADHGNYTRLFDTLPHVADYNAVTMFGVLEHLRDPLSFLFEFANSHRIAVTVPNGTSFHRLLGVKLGLIDSPDYLSSTDLHVGHHQYFTPDTFKRLLDDFCKKSGHKIYEIGSHCLKFGSNPQMMDFLEISGSIDNVANEIGVIGKDRFYGAELYAFLGVD